MGAKYTLGPDVDLTKENVRDSRGNRITEDYVERAVEDVAQARRARRPSLSGGTEHSPQVSFRVPDELRERAEAKARREGKTLSALAREAFEDMLRAA